jgi:hypothetical protein
VSEPVPVTYLSTEDVVVAGERLFGGKMAVLLLYGFNGYRLTATEDERVEIVVDIAAGELDSVPAIAERLAGWAVRR